ncbi:unnamed protein product [Lupinus luteus]|uniref:RanBP2-type domain-containing protein n=1 Tax=Lupinus luteus TaxID=3873 RepID=A0AAV1WD55_LUPLU
MKFVVSSFSLLLNPIIFKTSQFSIFPCNRITMSSWACKECTFVNPHSQKSQCQICLTPLLPPSSPSSSSSSSSSLPKWSCKACTFLNLYKNSVCEICGTRCPVLSLSHFHDLNDTVSDADVDSSVGSVFFPLRSCKRKAIDDSDESERFRELKAKPSNLAVDFDQTDKFPEADIHFSDKATNLMADNVDSGKAVSSFKILTYNVWFREDLELHNRMKAIGDLVQLHSPDFICFQEVTGNIYDIFKQSRWWNLYHCSVSTEKAHSKAYFCMMLSKLPVKSFSNKPFHNSIMGRELCIAEAETASGMPLVVATSHLESPCPAPPKFDQMFSKERVEQANVALNLLEKHPNVVFGGDMNWCDKLDGHYPSQDGWIDAWAQLRPKENGFTYDTKSNQMLTGNRSLRKRLDRFICRLRDLKISSIEMIGMDAIAGLVYIKEKKVRNEIKQLPLPVLPSDHYGLILTISSKE